MVIKHIQYTVFVLVLLFGLSSTCWQAAKATDQDTPIFIEALGDVPMMPELEMREESLVLFDKAQGRYAEISATARKQVSQQDILNFYASALPALGWINVSASSYKRGQETLKIELKNVEGLVVARFIVSPAKN